MHVDFRDLNKKNPKDHILLPHIDLLVDNTVGHHLLRFIDSYARYNQIKLTKEDHAIRQFLI